MTCGAGCAETAAPKAIPRSVATIAQIRGITEPILAQRSLERLRFVPG
jgi:hypothetical protein